MRIKKGDIVGRKSYGKDVFFIVDKILKSRMNKEFALLKGLNIRIMADSPIEDLEMISKQEVLNSIKLSDMYLETRIKKNSQRKKTSEQLTRQRIYTGKILHLDGDRKYSEKSARYYNKIGLNAVIKNITENRQSKVIIPLLNKYNPDILVITGHDAMLKNGTNYNNIYNYRNSRHFINTVKEARTWGVNSDKLVIFAGACQSFYEGIMSAGADFASSPGRILIDFVDPLIVAEKIAVTEEYKFVSINEIAKEVKEGLRGISGIGARGKSRIIE
ncbi:MAG: sporulation peptidase YabG [Clostridia bacterium]|nr:sporulation peptidase YabG [Clostridia bacterium]